MSNFQVNYNAGGVVDDVKKLRLVEEIGSIRGFATKTQPYNVMERYDLPAIRQINEFEIELPNKECEILAITVTCSGYDEEDNYDLFFNDQRWFEHWYCSEVKEGLFLGSSTYVYAAPAGSRIRLAFRNAGGTAKKVWVGVRMLVDPD